MIDNDTKREVQTAMAKSIDSLYRMHPLYASVIMQQVRIYTERVPTAAVDGKHLYVNPEFFLGLIPAERVFILAHEAAHIWKLDPIRFKMLCGDKPNKAELMKCNISADLGINNVLVQTKMGAMPDSGLLDPSPITKGMVHQHQLKDMAWEQIYPHVYMKEADVPVGSGKEGDKDSNPLGMGGVLPMDTEDMTDEQAKQEAENRNLRAAKDAENVKPGSQSAQMAKDYIESFGTKTVSWPEHLKRYIIESLGLLGNDFSFRRPRRRYISSGIYLPGRVGKGEITMVIAVDTSGSMYNTRTQQAVGEVKNILKALRPLVAKLDLHFITCDSSIQEHKQYSVYDLPDDIKMTGGGGTRMRPVFDRIRKRDIKPNLLVYCSDMEIMDEGLKKPPYPCIFLACTESDEYYKQYCPDWIVADTILVEKVEC